MGQFKNSKKHGKGEMDYANGDKYTGDWVADNRTGKGVYVCANRNQYEIGYPNITSYGTIRC
jgi:hypothetical protein